MRRFVPVLLASILLGACSQSGSLTQKNDRTYVVFFPFASTDLDDSANKTISQAATYAKKFPEKQVYVKGYAAIYGDLSKDEMMAIQRAKIVAQKVVDDGVLSNRVHDIPRPPENRKSQVAARRVEIIVQ
ncbi:MULTISPECIES: OmpA family protein [Commensalibacter]|uniref:OmpA family protein n=1 Tax=Commensalibacter TaxID=1079922 RepID=UPI000EFC31CE|nr:MULTISPECIES: OmpA family protein [Commensalibacter]MCT6895700.1 OmpA family protein [Commensalibacter sp.]AYN86956.1 hypothetical protein D9V35_05330 [Commensalibacter melissae]MBH9972911.1 OmpA family protein [Commensalibacter melissae]MBI0016558.1 OmpA family protein [Commensalibacter sp. B14384M2]MBI0018305.1 OmpA family protein [Commensalibacter sp. W8133]